MITRKVLDCVSFEEAQRFGDVFTSHLGIGWHEIWPNNSEGDLKSFCFIMHFEDEKVYENFMSKLTGELYGALIK